MKPGSTAQLIEELKSLVIEVRKELRHQVGPSMPETWHDVKEIVLDPP